MDQINQLETMM